MDSSYRGACTCGHSVFQHSQGRLSCSDCSCRQYWVLTREVCRIGPEYHRTVDGLPYNPAHKVKTEISYKATGRFTPHQTPTVLVPMPPSVTVDDVGKAFIRAVPNSPHMDTATQCQCGHIARHHRTTIGGRRQKTTRCFGVCYRARKSEMCECQGFQSAALVENQEAAK